MCNSNVLQQYGEYYSGVSQQCEGCIIAMYCSNAGRITMVFYSGVDGELQVLQKCNECITPMRMVYYSNAWGVLQPMDYSTGGRDSLLVRAPDS